MAFGAHGVTLVWVVHYGLTSVLFPHYTDILFRAHPAARVAGVWCYSFITTMCLARAATKWPCAWLTLVCP